VTPATKILLAAGANLAAWDYAARCAGLPSWAGLTVAGVGMTLAAARAPLPPVGHATVRLVNAPGNFLVGVIERAPELEGE
jgi:hypothetical protein